MSDFDFDATYKVVDRGGIAWRAISYEMIHDEDYYWSGIEHENREKVLAHMVGDDRIETFEISELEKIAEEDYCPECGQIGCKAYAY